jgi:hypothetical protein
MAYYARARRDCHDAHINIQLGSQMVRGSFARDAQPLHLAHD